MGWRWSECYVLKTNFVLTNRLYILQIKIKLKQVKELILIMRTVSREFSTFAFPQSTIFESWGIIWLLPLIHCCFLTMLGTNGVLSIQNISMQKIDRWGGGGEFCRYAENWRATTSMGPVGGGGELLTPRPLPSIGPSDHTYFLLLNNVLWILNLIFHHKRITYSIHFLV